MKPRNITMALTGRGACNLARNLSQTRIFSRTFSSSKKKEDTNPSELFGRGQQGESHKNNETVADVANRVYEARENLKENAQNSMERTGEKMEKSNQKDKGVVNNGREMNRIDEDEMKEKAAKGLGGKPVDEDMGLDVNWRPIDEKKPS